VGIVDTVRDKAFLLASFVVAIVAAASLLAQVAAAAAAHTTVHPASFSFEAQLPTSNGYSMFLRGYGHRRIELDLGTENVEKPYITMDYTTEGKVNRHGIDADFGRFGRIELNFVGSPQRSVSHSPNCRPHGPDVNEYGRMTGSAEFETLGGVVKLDSHQLSVEGETWSSPKQTCTPKPSKVVYGGTAMEARRAHRVEKGEGFVTTVMARAHTMGRTIDIYAFKLNHEFVPDVAATSTRRFGKVLTSTSVHAPDGEEGPGEAVRLSINGGGTRPQGAVLSAAAPFSGSATYRKRSGVAPTWLGSLAVEIPGEGTLPLAGPDFHAIACAYASNKLQRACERTVAPAHTA
jgi:hypothetical protein